MSALSKQFYTVYFSGALFDHKQLIGNAYLAEAIFERSHGRFRPLLPQNFEARRGTAQSIRDHDLRTLVACDLALFHFDGNEPDSGTLVEFVYAKTADIPCVVLSSDSRQAATRGKTAWNIMTRFWPRTVPVMLDALESFHRTRRRRGVRTPADEVTRLAGQHTSAGAQIVCEQIAAAAVRGLERAIKLPPAMPKHLREEVYQWLALMPGLRGKEKLLRTEFEHHLERKVDRDLL